MDDYLDLKDVLFFEEGYCIIRFNMADDKDKESNFSKGFETGCGAIVAVFLFLLVVGFCCGGGGR
jgi:hypothetical protein